MEIGILNPEHIRVPVTLEYMEVVRYSMFGPLPEDLNEPWGMIVNLAFLTDTVGAVADDGTMLTTPCPSHVDKWTQAITVAMKDIRSSGLPAPSQIWIPGAIRPVLTLTKDEYYLACCCGDCVGERHIAEALEALEDTDKQSLERMGADLLNSGAVSRFAKRMSAKAREFDKAMETSVHEFFPEVKVSHYMHLSERALDGMFMPTPSYYIRPTTMLTEHGGGLLLETTLDFQLAATLFTGAGSVLVEVPPLDRELEDGGFEDDDDEEIDHSLRELYMEMMCDFLGIQRDTREAAERYLRLIAGGGDAVA